jgi:imidazolonepropionase-like amidohydrolase
MKKFVLGCVLATIPLLAQQRDIFVIRGATLIDGTIRPPVRNAVVVVEKGKILFAGPRDKVKVPSNSPTLDATGKWIIPGLIDAHIHFFQSGGLYTRPDVIDLRTRRPYEAERQWIRDRLPMTFARYLACGITAVVDVGGPMLNFEVRDLAAQTKIAPRVAVAGPLVSTSATPDVEGSDPSVITATSPAHARELVGRQLERKPDLIKILFVREPGDDFAKQTEIVKAVIETSRAGGVRVAVHATELETAKAAVQAGADILVHSITDRRVDREFMELVTKRDVLYITTLFVEEGYFGVLNQKVGLSEPEKRLGDPEVIATWSDLGKIQPNEIPGGVPRIPAPEKRPVSYENLALLEAAGVRIAAGTDAGNIGTLHGPSLYREFDFMAEAGMRPSEIIVAATRNAAAVMGREKELGTLEPGKLADLVILDGDPQRDIRNTQKIFKVMKGGEFIEVPPESLK